MGSDFLRDVLREQGVSVPADEGRAEQIGATARKAPETAAFPDDMDDVAAEPRIQPAWDDEPQGAEFVVTAPRDVPNWEPGKGAFLRGTGALPYPRWPHPGEPVNLEDDAHMFRENNLYVSANVALQRHLQWLRAYGDAGPDPNDPYREWLHRDALADLNFLKGLWAAKGIPIPSDDDLRAMAGLARREQAQEPEASPWTEETGRTPAPDPESFEGRYPAIARFLDGRR